MRSFRLTAVAALATALLTVPNPVNSAQPEPYEIGTLLALTGGSSFTDVRIRDSMIALERIINERGGVNGHPLHFTFYDDAANPATAVELASQLVAKHPAIILGPSQVSTCRATAPITANGPVEWCFSPGVPITPRGYLFGALVATHENLITTVAYLRQRGWKKLALLVPIDATGQDGEQSIDDAFALPENAGIMRVVARERFNGTDLSVGAQLARIKASNPDAVIAWTTGAPLQTVLRGMQQAGIDYPVITTPGNMNHVQMDAMAKVIPKAGLFFTASLVQAHDALLPGPIKDAQNEYFRAFREAHFTPEPGSSYAWDPALILIEALRHLGTNASAAQIHDYIEQVHGFAGIHGIYDFRDGMQHGLTRSAGIVARWSPEKNDWIAVTHPGGKPL
jgi:branched-chain amino acid transport system substrate-binding protein